MENNCKIPKIIHQIWIGDLPKPIKWMKTWEDKHPDWEYRLWGNEELKKTKWENKKLIDRYAEKKLWHGVADIMRYEILYKYGGIMPGADSECLEPLDELFSDGYSNYAVDTSHKDGVEESPANRGSCAPLYACKKGSGMAKRLIERLGMLEDAPLLPPALMTGNRLMRNVVRRYGYELKVFPIHCFLPEHPDGWKYKGTDKIYAKHHWGSTLGCYAEGL